MESNSERFVEIATGSVANRGRCIEIKEIGKEILHCQTSKQELYRSHYFFDSSLRDHLRTYKTVRGFLGKTFIESIILDIDKGADTDEQVLVRARNIYHKLKEIYEVDDINIRPHYSGSGFHIVVPNLWNFENHEEVKATMKEDFPELDYSIYDRTKIIRVANTVNYKTQRYKIPLELREFLNSTIEEIIQAAEQPRNNFEWYPFEEGTSLEKYKKKPKVLTNTDGMANDGFSPIVTCMQKLYVSEPKQGTRHINMLRMISAYKRAGIPREGIEAMMMKWARAQMEIGEVRKIVGDIFSKNYSYSCSDEIMHQWCDNRCLFFKNKNYNNAQPEDTKTMEDKMKLFALEGDKNVIINLKDFLHIPTDFKIYRKEMVTFIGDTKLGKGLRLIEDIPTTNGWKKAGEIKVGDYFFGSDGNPTRVQIVSDIHYRDNYKITFKDGSSIITDDQHLWTVNVISKHKKKFLRKDITISTIEMFNRGIWKLKSISRSKYRIRLTKPVLYFKKYLSISPYLLGCWLGDGSKATSRISSADIEIVNEFEKEYKVHKEQNYSYYISQGLRKQLRKLNLLFNKHIPEIYLLGSIEQRIELVRGLMDTDGCAELTNVFYNTNKTIIDGMIELLNSLGVKTMLSEKHSIFNGKEYDLCYRINFTAWFNPFKLKRKADKAIISKQDQRSNFRYIENIEKVDSQPTVCFKVDARDELFLATKSYIVTHNSALAQNIAVALSNRKVLYLNFEVGETLMYRRFLQIAHIKSKEAIIEHYLQPEPGSLAGPIEHIEMISTRITLHALEQLISMKQYDLVIADTLECFQTPGVSEITPKTELIAHELKRIALKYNLVIMPIHHVSKHGVQNVDGSKKKLTSHSGKGSGAIEQQSDKIISFEGNQDRPLRNLRSLGARDETPFNTYLHFDAENSFRFYKVQKEAVLTSSESPEANRDMELNSSMSYHHSS